MTHSRLPIRLSAWADADYENIAVYGIRIWGEERAASYIAWIDREIDSLSTFPSLGRRRRDIGPNARCLPVGEHIVYHRVEPDGIYVTRILHSRQNAAAASGI
jgi:toxin ParE1/3/4